MSVSDPNNIPPCDDDPDDAGTWVLCSDGKYYPAGHEPWRTGGER